MKVWLLLAIVILLLAFSRKEGFNPATTRPSRADESIVKTVTSYAGLDAVQDTAKVDKYILAIQQFYDNKYLPEKKTPEDSVVKEFVAAQTDTDIDKTKLANIINYVFLTTAGNTAAANTPSAMSQTPTARETASTTGGSSGTALGPSSGGSDRNLWGPEYPGVGDGVEWGSRGDSTSTRNYPVLLGPKPDASTMSPAGIVPPSKSWQLANGGDLPNEKALGSGEGSQYLPYSRVPGDKDLIPDPYRVAAAFSASTYSTKTEPVPFLTDFSAFQK